MAEPQLVVNVCIAICNVRDDHPRAPDVLPNFSNYRLRTENLITSQWFQPFRFDGFLDDVFVVTVERVVDGHQNEAKLVIDLRTVDHTLQG